MPQEKSFSILFLQDRDREESETMAHGERAPSGFQDEANKRLMAMGYPPGPPQVHLAMLSPRADTTVKTRAKPNV